MVTLSESSTLADDSYHRPTQHFHPNQGNTDDTRVYLSSARTRVVDLADEFACTHYALLSPLLRSIRMRGRATQPAGMPRELAFDTIDQVWLDLDDSSGGTPLREIRTRTEATTGVASRDIYMIGGRDSNNLRHYGFGPLERMGGIASHIETVMRTEPPWPESALSELSLIERADTGSLAKVYDPDEQTVCLGILDPPAKEPSTLTHARDLFMSAGPSTGTREDTLLDTYIASVGQKIISYVMKGRAPNRVESNPVAEPHNNYQHIPKQLMDLFSEIENLSDDWDSYGAARISSWSIGEAKKIVNDGMGLSLGSPAVSPASGAAVGIEWRTGGGELVIDVDPKLGITYFIVETRSGVEDEGEMDDNNRLGILQRVKDL